MESGEGYQKVSIFFKKPENEFLQNCENLIPLLTSDLFCDILSLLLGDKQLNCHFTKWRR